jgi:tetratricopeptide (TPR) repeat protein
MCSSQNVLSVRSLTFLGAWMLIAPAFAQEPFRVAKDGAKAGGDQQRSEISAADSKSEELPETREGLALQSIDQIIEIVKCLGNSDNVANWRVYRDQFPAGDEIDCTGQLAARSCELASDLAKHGELLSARKLMPIALRLAEAVKERSPTLFMIVNGEAAMLDIDFELYDSASKHMSIALKAAKEDGVDRHDSISCQSHYAFLLRKQKRFDESEKIYLDLLRQTNENPEGFSKIELYDLKFSLAVLYAEKGEFEKHLKATKALPGGLGKQVDEDVREYGRRMIMLDTAVVNCGISTNKLDPAEKAALNAVERAQKYFGASSLEHVEAIELLSKVRVAQFQYAEAAVLLKKSADIRAGLLGDDHPSVARLHKEIDAIRNKQLTKVEPIWEPGGEAFGPEPVDRYSQSVPADFTAAEGRWLCQAVLFSSTGQALPIVPVAIGFAAGHPGSSAFR